MTTATAKNVKDTRKKMDISRKQLSIRKIKQQRKLLRFDLAIQRNAVWKETEAMPQKTKLIDSILRNFPIPQVFVIHTEDKFVWLADGKQRYTTIFGYIDNEFPLAKGTKPVLHEDENGNAVEYEVEGKLFKDLPKELQNHILEYEMDIREIRNATKSDIEELFVRLNNGTPLSKMELTRATIGTENQDKINEIAKLRFYSDMAFISDTSRNRFIDQEMIIQTLMLVMGRETGISSKDIAAFTASVREVGIPDETMKFMNGAAQYLADALEQFVVKSEDGKEVMPILNKMLKKVHIPMLVVTAIEAIQREIEAEVFGQWAYSFLVDRYTSGSGVYGKHCVVGSAKKDNVMGRLKAMKADFSKQISAIKNEWEAAAPLREQKRKLAEQAAAELLKRQQEEQGGEGGEGDATNSGEGDGDNQEGEGSNDEVGASNDEPTENEPAAEENADQKTSNEESSASQEQQEAASNEEVAASTEE